MDQALSNVTRLVEAFRTLHRDILANEMLTFLFVAHNEGLQMSDLEDMLGLSQAAVSRNVNYLTRDGVGSRSGTDLLQLVEDVENRRRRRVYLTPKGKAFIRTLEGLIR